MKKNIIETFENWNHKKLEIFTDPFPHIICDDLLPENIIEDLDKHWPETNLFEYEANRTLGTLQFSERFYDLDKCDQHVWANFFQDSFRKIIKSIFAEFSGIFVQRFDIDHIGFGGLMLQQVDNEKSMTPNWELPAHLHYAHDPLWLFSVLLQLDNGPGTTLYKTKGAIPTPDFISAFKWHEGVGEQIFETKEVPFRRNRLFAMLDSPLSFHGVKMIGASRRRTIRAHLAVPEELCVDLYDLTLPSWREKARAGLINEHIKKDVEFFSSLKTIPSPIKTDIEVRYIIEEMNRTRPIAER